MDTRQDKIDDFWGYSECANNYLHRYEIIEESLDGVVEQCSLCGDKQFFKIIDGRIDTTNYLLYHARQALPPFHPLYKHEYQK
jgi:hypothetical protein